MMLVHCLESGVAECSGISGHRKGEESYGKDLRWDCVWQKNAVLIYLQHSVCVCDEVDEVNNSGSIVERRGINIKDGELVWVCLCTRKKKNFPAGHWVAVECPTHSGLSFVPSQQTNLSSCSPHACLFILGRRAPLSLVHVTCWWM